MSNCCAWTNTKALANNGAIRRGDNLCGAAIQKGFEAQRNMCCAKENTTSASSGDCDASKWPKGPAFGAILTFAAREDMWIKTYT